MKHRIIGTVFWIVLLISLLGLLIAVCHADTIMVAKKKSSGSFDWATNLKAVYNYETGALTTDSSGQGNTLTNSAVTADGTYYKQGSYSADNGGGAGYSYRTDANLSTGFPSKSSGGSGSFLVMGWVYFTTLSNGTTNQLFGKYYATDTERSFRVSVLTSSSISNIAVNISPDGTTTNLLSDTLDSSDGWPNLVINTWYHIAFWYDEASTTYGVRLYVDGGSTYNKTASYTYGVFLSGQEWCNFCTNPGYSMIKGKLDQVVVYGWDGTGPTETQLNTQIDGIRGGTIVPESQ